jgi:hypothetical protein
VVIEHAFISTMPPAELFAAAGAFLSERGFQAQAQAAFVMGGQWDALEMARGAPSAFKAKNIAEYPTRVRIEWDRGRVVVAARIDSKNEKQEKGIPRPVLPSQINLDRAKVIDALACVLSTITFSIEALLSRRDEEAADVEWTLLDKGLQKRALSRRSGINPMTIFFVIGGIVFVAIIVLIVILITNPFFFR